MSQLAAPFLLPREGLGAGVGSAQALVQNTHPKSVRWLLRAPSEPRVVAALARELKLPFVVAALLAARGLSATESLKPPLVPSPNPGFGLAAEQIIRALRSGKRIRVHGDYDADGITASSILVLGLRELGADVHGFIPDRLGDGYGIHPERVPEHAAACDLFITVDCGVANLLEVEALVKEGLEVIVTDHHTPGRELPGCLIVHPALAPEHKHGMPALTGAGVAFHLLWAVRRELGLSVPLDYADLATIGTIADVAPILGENRALVRAGLERLADSRWPGLRAVLERQGLAAPVAREVAFVVAPRINAAGRMGEAGLAFEFLTTDDEARARELDLRLEALNTERKFVQQTMFAEALELADPSAPALVLTKTNWHVGVMGIVAAKLLEHAAKPVFLAAAGKGSVRTPNGFSAVEALSHAQAHLKRFGGHSSAAGFALDEAAWSDFRDSIFQFARAQGEVPRVVYGDAFLDPSEVTDDLESAIRTLEPFGEGFPRPTFFVREQLRDVRGMGAEARHLGFRLGGVRGKRWDTRGFVSGDLVDAAVMIEQNDWQGCRTLEFHAAELRYAAPLSVEGNCEFIYPRLETRVFLERATSRNETQTEPVGRVFAHGDALAWVRKHHPDLSIWRDGEDFAGTLTLISPPSPAQLGAWIREGAPLEFALTPRTLDALSDKIFWTRDRLWRVRNERDLPPRARALLPLLDDPDAEELLFEEAEAYRLRTFVRLYRFADEVGFSIGVRCLYEGAVGSEGVFDRDFN